jgi:SpoIID/LytB domain protein
VAKSKRHIIFIIVLLLALSFAFSITPAYAAAFYTDIRVLLSVGSPRSIDLTIIGDYYLEEDPSFEFQSDKVTISVTGNRPVLTSDNNTFTASSVTLASRDYSGTSSYIRLKNSLYGTCTYLGDITFDVINGRLRAINTLPIDHYVYGVISHEMDNSFPMEALKAQAVSSRGYGVYNCLINRLGEYDIRDTSADQVYHGYATRYTRVIKAVDETAGQVIMYKGKVIQTFYSASNGGQTDPTGYRWKNDLPYYIQADDVYDVRNPDSLEEKSFIPSEFDSETLPIMDEIVLGMLQQGANEAAGEDVELLGTVRAKGRDARYDPPSRCYTKVDIVLMVAAADGKRGQLTVTLPFSDLIQSDDNPKGIFNKKHSLSMRGAEQGVYKTEDGKEYVGWFLTNRRWGHGIGLSQRSAQQRATDGQDYKEILAFYYVNTQLCTIGTFESAPALTSGKYAISEHFVSGIAPGTSPGRLLSGISSEEGDLSVITSKGNEKKVSDVSTGDFVRTVYGDGASYFDLPVVLYGDTNGDGKITQGDLDALRQHLLNTNKLVSVYLEAADVNHDGKADSLDVLQLLKHIHGASSIEQSGGKAE